jgi:hypothetical protein
VAEQFHTFYESDWGGEQAARARRDSLRGDLVARDRTVVRGTVQHPVFGRGFEVWSHWAGDIGGGQDYRVTPMETITQTPPSLVYAEG